MLVFSPRLPLRVLALVFVLLGMAASAQTTYTVTRFDDTSHATLEPGGGYGPGVSGDLRYGLYQAMATGGNYTINFACSAPTCTISLNAPLPPIFEATANTGATSVASFNLTIDGGAPGNVDIYGGGTFRIFWVDNVAVTLKNLYLSSGKASGGNGGIGYAGGGGGAGFGGCLFVNKSTAVVNIVGTNFQSCAVQGGQGAASRGSNYGSGAGGTLGGAGAIAGSAFNAGGGAFFANSYSGAGGAGMAAAGSNTTTSYLGGNGGAGGGGGGGSEYGTPGTGGSAFASNDAGASGTGSGGTGGFGGGGGGGADWNGSSAHTLGGNGGFGGGGGGSLDGNGGNGGFGGGGGSSLNAPCSGCLSGGNGGTSAAAVGGVTGGTGQTGGAFGGGGAAAGASIFVAYGTVNIQGSGGFNSTYPNNPAIAGAAGGTGATAGTADQSAVFNYAGTVNGSTITGGLPNALPLAYPPFAMTGNGVYPSITEDVKMTFTTAVAANTPFTVTGTMLGAATGDFTATLDPEIDSTKFCTSGQAYAVGATCLIQITHRPLLPGLRLGAATLTTTSTPAVVLATTYVSSNDAAALVSMTPGTISTFAGYTTSATHDVSIGQARDIAMDGAGNLYIADTQDAIVYELNVTTGALTVIAGGGSGGSTYTGPATGAVILPVSVALDGAGNLYISDRVSKLVRKVNLATGIMTTAAGGGSSSAAASGIAATSAYLSNPGQLAVDPSGNLYIADYGLALIREVSASTGIISTVAGGGFSTANGVAATTAALGSDIGIALDGSGNLYLSDVTNNIVREVSGGVINTVAGGGSSTSSGVPALSASLNAPQYLSTDSAGNVYIVDNTLVHRLNVASGLLYTVAGGGTYGTSGNGDNGPAIGAYIAPAATTLDTSGNLYIADGTFSIRKVTATAANVTFPNTAVNGTSATQTVMVNNIGNYALTVSVPSSGHNPTLSPNFSISNSSTCPLVYSNSSAGTIAAGTTCNEILTYTPTVSGSVSGLLTFTDSTPRAVASTQSVSLAGSTSTAVTVQVIGQNVAAGTATASLEFLIGYSAAGTPTGTPVITLDGGSANVGAYTCTAKNLHNTCYVTITTSGLSAGDHLLTVTQPADSNYSSANATGILTIVGSTAPVHGVIIGAPVAAIPVAPSSSAKAPVVLTPQSTVAPASRPTIWLGGEIVNAPADDAATPKCDAADAACKDTAK